MTYQRFEDLPVWQEAIRLAERVYLLTEDAAFQKQYSLQDQLERATVSVSNNVAEGFERAHHGRTARVHLHRARFGGRSALHALFAGTLAPLRPFENLKFPDLKSSAESCSRQLRAWAANLQDSPIEGQRRLTQATRNRSDERKRAEAFTRKLKENFKPAVFRNPPRTNSQT